VALARQPRWSDAEKGRVVVKNLHGGLLIFNLIQHALSGMDPAWPTCLTAPFSG
jgi:hypothetical protein